MKGKKRNGRLIKTTMAGAVAVSLVAPSFVTVQAQETENGTANTVEEKKKRANLKAGSKTVTVTSNNFLDYFQLGGTNASYDKSTGTVTLTEDAANQVGNFYLKDKIDLSQDFTLQGQINLGNKNQSQGGADGMGFAFHPGNIDELGYSGAALGISGLPNAFGFKFDTYFNGTIDAGVKTYDDPAGFEDTTFGGFVYTEPDGWGGMYTGRNDEAGKPKVISDPVNNGFEAVVFSYSAATKTMTVTYDGKTWSKDITSWMNSGGGTTAYAFSVSASTGTNYNMHQFKINSFQYTSAFGVVKVQYKDLATGNDLAPEEILQGDIGEDYSTTKKTFTDYTFVRVEGNETGQFAEEDQTVTYYYSDSSNAAPQVTANDKTIHVKEGLDLATLATATDKEDGNLTDSIVITGTVNNQVPGDYPITYTVTDSGGKTTSQTITVHVINDAPVIEAENQTIKTGTTFNPLDYATATDTEDGDSTSKITVKENTVDTTTPGEYKVVYEVIDDTGAVATKEIKVTVIQGNEAPVITAEDKTIHVKESITLKDLATALDVEDGDLTSDIQISGTVDNLVPGDYPITYTVTDSEGKTATKTITVHVINDAPTIAAEDQVVAFGSEFDPLAYATAADTEDGTITNKIRVKENTVDTSRPGEYKVVYEVTDDTGAKATKEIKVTVTNEPPVITAVDQTLPFGSEFDPTKYATAEDKEDGSLTDKIKVTENTVNPQIPGEYKVKYEVTDAAGATTTKEIKVTITNEAPEIEAEDQTIAFGSTFDPLDYATAKDKEDGNLTDEIKVTENTVNPQIPGEYTVKYEVTDAAGVTTTKEIKVTVTNEAPEIQVPDTIEVHGTVFDPLTYATATDKEDGDITSQLKVIENTVDTSTPGTYTVTYEVTDATGVTTTKTVQVLVQNDAPTITAEDQVVPFGSEFDPFAYATAADTEDGDLTGELEVLENHVDTTTPGEYTVKYKVTDTAGATTTKEIKVTVTNEAPEIKAEDQTIPFGSKFDPLDYATAKDKEDGDLTDEIKVTENTVNPLVPGEYKVKYEVTDAAGVTTTKEITVHVTNEAPVIQADDEIDINGTSFDPLDYATATDKEDGNLTNKIVVLENNVDPTTTGDYTVTYEVTDAAGVVTTKTITVHVKNDPPEIEAEDQVIAKGSQFDPLAFVTALDKQDGVIDSKVRVIESTVDTSTPGTYKVVYEVTDAAGVTTRKEIQVIVTESEQPADNDASNDANSDANGESNSGANGESNSGANSKANDELTVTGNTEQSEDSRVRKAADKLPETGDQSGKALPIIGLGLAAVSAFLFRRKK
ncbi:immunoglobulin-like domain-containing protein [Listeria costaricensis]|uniref:immunoglobulin-like domain-containing protein n=1 Tax=Listeria costaricensis TaxID=2026604 RepID=UPI000C085E8A|nr:immunoglobulin-like domain-containing protein [Listeria costaricensis]